MIDQPTLDLLIKTAQAAADRTSKIVKAPPNEPDAVYLIAHADGTLERRVADAPYRNHTLFDLDAVVDFATRMLAKTDDAAEEPPPPAFTPTIWFSQSGVVVLDDGDRRNRATLTLALNEQLLTIQALREGRKIYPQREFVQLLRIDLAGCLPDGRLIDLVRNVKVDSQSGVDSSIQRGTESVSRSLKASLTGAELLPDMVSLMVPVFDNPAFSIRYPVTCALEVHLQGPGFQLIPLPGHIEAIIAAAEAGIGQTLDGALGDKLPIHYGQP
jgi:hypothetical protein